MLKHNAQHFGANINPILTEWFLQFCSVTRL